MIHKPAPALPEGTHADPLLQGGEPGKFEPQGGLPTQADTSSDRAADNIE
jgi:hypothetical protein